MPRLPHAIVGGLVAMLVTSCSSPVTDAGIVSAPPAETLAEAEPVIEREAFKLLQQINSAK